MVNFGKHEGKTYLQVRLRHPDYIDWARRAVEDGGSHPDLKRLVRYFDMPHSDSPRDIPVPEEPSTGKPTAAKSKAKAKAASSKSSSSDPEANQAIILEQQRLNQEIAGLKEALTKATASKPVKRGSSSGEGMTVDQANSLDGNDTAAVLRGLMERLDAMERRQAAGSQSSSVTGGWTPVKVDDDL